jgi:hypothetical protein
MRQRWLGACILVLTLVIGNAVQPLISRTSASEINTGDTNAGTIGTAGSTAPHAATYGPVDQSAPLDFSTQPKSVPRVYVPGRLYNVEVLKQDSYAQILGQMAYFSSALGVGCSYCHVVTNFAYDTPTKKIARTMVIMQSRIQSEHIDAVHKAYPNYAVNGAVGCETCHRGAPLIAVQYNVVPVQYLDWPAKSSRQAGYVVNSMYSVSRSLGVNCLFCHNSADFVTLQYYPTNQIAHRMWHMLDDINHKYLPPNVEAVTCYTCHQGAKWPNQLVAGGTDETPVQAKALNPAVNKSTVSDTP